MARVAAVTFDLRELALDDDLTTSRASRKTESILGWVLLGDKPGENAQLEAIAAALGRRFHIVRVPRARAQAMAGSAASGDPPQAETGESGAWPDLVIALGPHAGAAARAVRAAGGGRAKLVLLGRPRADFRAFDLIITTPQYGLPAWRQIVELPMPLNAPRAEEIEAAVRRWRPVLADLPRPWTAVLVGGAMKTYRLDAEVVLDLAHAAEALRRRTGGSLLVSTSPRTQPEIAASLDPFGAPRHLFAWRPGMDNPYLALLGLADRFVVTGDSASMLAEACRQGRPVYIYDLPRRRRRRTPTAHARRLVGRMAQPSRSAAPLRWRDPLRRVAGFLIARGWVSPPLDMALLHRALVESGRARLLSDAGPIDPATARGDADLRRAAAAIEGLFGAPA